MNKCMVLRAKSTCYRLADLYKRVAIQLDFVTTSKNSSSLVVLGFWSPLNNVEQLFIHDEFLGRPV